MMGKTVTSIDWDILNGITSVSIEGNNMPQKITGTHFINSLPIRDVINMMKPQPPARVVEAANKLKYRDFLIVTLIIDKPCIFDDNWDLCS